MSQTIRIVQVGLGPIGRRLTQFLLERPDLKIVGGVDLDPALRGEDVGQLAGLEHPLGVTITDQLPTAGDADVVVLTTSSSLEKVAPTILDCVERGFSVVSTCEELAYPWRTAPDLAWEIDEAAKDNGVAVLGTGINPGFLMDLLPTALTGVCRSVQRVYVERVQDAQHRRLPFQKKIGAGLSPEQFQEQVNAGTLRHVGLIESIHMIAARLGWTLSKTEDLIEPVIASETFRGAELTVEPGQCLGVQQTGLGYDANGAVVIELLFRAVVGQASPHDRVVLESDPPIDMTITGGVHGDTGTCAVVVNAIPSVAHARFGLRTMADIEPIACWSTLPDA